MKKIFALLIAGSIALTAFVGCSNKEEVIPEVTTEEVTTEEVAPEVTPEAGAPNTITAEGEMDERGWKAIVELTVDEANAITAVDFDYVNAEGAKKSEDEEYNKNMAEKSGIAVVDAIGQLEAQLIEKQDIEKVDTVAGATSTTEDFKALVNTALQK